MTVSNTNTKLQYSGDGSNRTFAITFPLLSAAHLRVITTDADGVETEVSAHYTLSPALDSITYPTVESGLAPLPAGSKITLLRQTPLTQALDLQSGHIMDAKELERGYDKLTYMVQELQESVGRALKCKVSETDERTAEAFVEEVTEAATEAKTAAQSSAASASAAQSAASAAATQNNQAADYASQAAGAASNAAQQANNAEQYKTAAVNASNAADAAKTAAETAAASAQSAASAISRAISTHNTAADAHGDIRQAVEAKQDKLTAGNNITIANGVISAQTAAPVTVDAALSAESENPVQNKVLKAALDAKQGALTAGTNITIENGVISAQAPAPVTVDAALSAESENPVQNKVLKAALDAKQGALTAGTNITIENGVISATGGGSGGTIDVDGSLSDTSTNPVQNKVIKAALDGKQSALTAGTNITIENGVISAQAPTPITVDAALSAESENPVQNKVLKAALDAKQGALTAGTNITIENGTINASFDTSNLVEKTDKGSVNGVAGLDGTGKIPSDQLPDLSQTYIPTAKKDVADGVAGLNANGKLSADKIPVDGESITVDDNGNLKAAGGNSGGSGHRIGDLIFNPSPNAADNAGRLPLFTGETIASVDTLYPDFYAWLQAHPAMTCTAAEYEAAMAEYGECPFYVLSTEDIYGEGVNIATRANAISSGEANFQSGYLDYPFDGEAAGANGTNYWSARGKGDYGDTFVGCYLGNINLTQKVTTIKMAQGIWSSSGVSSVKVQYSPDNGTTWEDLQTYDTPLQANYGDYNVLELPDYTPAATYGLRVMVVSEPTNIRSWWVYELQFLTAGTKIGEQIKLKLPIIKNYIKAANTADGVKNIAAGLPNIMGSVRHLYEHFDSASGALDSLGYSGNFGEANNAANRPCILNFDASHSNPIYGSSDTVTPPSTTLYPWVCAYTAAVPASTAQAAEFQAALSGKVDLPSGKTQADMDFVVESYSDDDGNWYRVYKSGWVEQGGSFDSASTVTVSFLKPFLDTAYTFISSSGANITSTSKKSGTTIIFDPTYNVSAKVGGDWAAYGKGAENV